MEHFRANLSNYRLALVVPALFEKRLFSGRLTLRRGAVERAFDFKEGHLVAASSNEAREHLSQVLCNLNILEVMEWEGRLEFLPVPRPAPAQLTADDLYVYSLLKATPSLRQALRSAAMGELAAYRAIRKLVAAGLVRVRGEGSRKRDTLPYGIPAIRA